MQGEGGASKNSHSSEPTSGKCGNEILGAFILKGHWGGKVSKNKGEGEKKGDSKVEGCHRCGSGEKDVWEKGSGVPRRTKGKATQSENRG